MVNPNDDAINPQLQGHAPEGFKRCSRCGEIKPTIEFGYDKSRGDKLRSYCKVCKRGQDRERYNNNVEKERERSRVYRDKNPDKRKATVRRWVEQNHEKVLTIKRRWKNGNREKENESARQYYHQRGKVTGHYRGTLHRRRARKRQLPTACPINIESILFDIQNGQCLYCQCTLTDGYHIDHIIPLALADLLGKYHPGHVPSNLALTCPKCNRSKNDALLEDWLQWKYPDKMDDILRRVDAHIADMIQRYDGSINE